MRGLLLLFLASAYLPAQERCPLLNAGTAGGVLGGAVKATVTQGPHKEDVTCQFSLQRDAIVSTLKIKVDTMTSPRIDFASYKAQCSSGDAVPLKAIGNEAIACHSDAADKQMAEQVISRVRQYAFVVRISSNDPALQPALREKARSVAEQVAGNLF